DLESRGYAYWALGHIHSPGPVRDRPTIWYAGCLQGRHFREAGPRGACLVSITNDGQGGANVAVELRNYAPVRWEKVEIGAIGRFRDASQLYDAVREEVEAVKLGAPGAQLSVRVTLEGES